MAAAFNASPLKPEDADEFRHLKQALLTMMLAAVIGLLGAQLGGWICAVGIGVEIILAAFSVGAVLGFLFAVPRIFSQNSTSSPDESSRGASARLLQSNTNLESISDWLTTMLVGVGISQLYRLNDALLSFREYIATTVHLADRSAGNLPAVAPLLLITGVVAGFIAMYLHTRLNLARLFNQTEVFLRGDARRAVVSVARSIGEETGSFASLAASGGTVTPDDALDLMFDLLYRPDGYRQVIDLAAQLSNSPAIKSATYWFLLSAAFGQQLAQAKASDDSALETSARDNALDAARRAVRIDPSYRARLWQISEPGGTDDDLAALRDDPDFLALTGRK